MMSNREFYQNTFSQVHSSAVLRWEDMEKRRRRRPGRKLLTLAVAAALLAALSTAAVAGGWFGLRNLELRETVTVTEQDGEVSTVSHPTGVIGLQGFDNTPELQAMREWQAFLSGYDDGGALEALGNDPSGFEEDYGFYGVYTQEMADKLEEVLAKYDLKIHTHMLDDIYTDEALCDQVGGDFLGENRAYSTYMYEDGTFKFDGEIDLAGYGTLDYQFMRCVRGSFTDVLLNIGSAAEYTEWSYTTANDIPVTLALAEHKSLIIANLPDSFVTINVLAGTGTPANDVFSSGSFEAEDLERFADSFDFSVLTPARPADPNLPRPRLEEVLGAPTPEEFAMRAGVEEIEAQAFYAEFFYAVEQGHRHSVAAFLHYPAVVTVTSGTFRVESAQEFLPYYDEIFTDSLWDSMIQNQYTMERADLFTHDGMIGAAGGSVWLAATENGLKVMTVQSSDGWSVRPQGEPGVSKG